MKAYKDSNIEISMKRAGQLDFAGPLSLYVWLMTK